ncbi:MAG TPA: amino acid permease [Gemmataceae bacterium]|nr:amino acid permease [Gemmataceae bacterium]
MATSDDPGGTAGQPSPAASLPRRHLRPAQVILVTSVMFTFIGYWRTAAVVLCDLASTAYYIGAIVEQAIGPAAPFFILAVMCFSYAVRSVYIESCTLFIRGGVYRVVREALGRFLAKIAVSALMFDYVLTGPISGVSAGGYIMGLLQAMLVKVYPDLAMSEPTRRWGAVVIACAITLYFYRLNIRGIQESSDRALKIMVATTIMGAVLIGWCGLTLALSDQKHELHLAPDLTAEKPDVNPDEQADPLGFLAHTPLGDALHRPPDQIDWLSVVGGIGILIAFGHSILAMSGEETLAQVYREVESPKLKNFKKAAFIVFIYSLLFTGLISFLAVLLIPRHERLTDYAENLLGGLAMHVWAPAWANHWPQLILNAVVVGVGFLILAGAVNTAIIGSNGVLNRVAEDGVLPDWFLKPHPRYGTTYRVLTLIVGLQLFTILASQGKTVLLGEAYAFGVVWSFVFQALSMVVLRFKDPRPREYMVPLNVKVRGVEVPVGLSLIFLVLATTAVLNLLTKEVATVGGLIFTGVFFTVFWLSEHYHERKRRGRHEHVEQFNQQTTPDVSAEALHLGKRYRKLVAIRSPYNLFMLEKALAETDPETTAVVVMTAKLIPPAGEPADGVELDTYDRQLMTAVVQLAERAGKEVKPLVVPTNNPLHAVMQIAKELQAQELIIGPSNRYTADEQMERIAFYWISLHHGQTPPLTVRILSKDRDVYLDLGGGNRIPKISERRARSVAELRAAGVGVDRVLLAHDGSPAASDLFQAVMTMLDPKVALGIVPIPTNGGELPGTGLTADREQARQLGRELQIHEVNGDRGQRIVDLAREGQYDLIILPLPPELPAGRVIELDERTSHVLRHAHCRVFLAAAPVIPHEVVDTQQPLS